MAEIELDSEPVVEMNSATTQSLGAVTVVSQPALTGENRLTDPGAPQ